MPKSLYGSLRFDRSPAELELYIPANPTYSPYVHTDMPDVEVRPHQDEYRRGDWKLIDNELVVWSPSGIPSAGMLQTVFARAKTQGRVCGVTVLIPSSRIYPETIYELNTRGFERIGSRYATDDYIAFGFQGRKPKAASPQPQETSKPEPSKPEPQPELSEEAKELRKVEQLQKRLRELASDENTTHEDIAKFSID